MHLCPDKFNSCDTVHFRQHNEAECGCEQLYLLNESGNLLLYKVLYMKTVHENGDGDILMKQYFPMAHTEE